MHLAGARRDAYVRGDEQRLEPEQRAPLRLDRGEGRGEVSILFPIVSQVLVERRARGHAGLLQLDDHREKSEVRSPKSSQFANRNWSFVISTAGDAELADQQEIIVRRLLPINHPQPLRLLHAALAVG